MTAASAARRITGGERGGDGPRGTAKAGTGVA